MTSENAPVVVLAGGTGGAKLARGMADVVGKDLVVIANTGDDDELYGAYVSPDPDLIAFWLSDRIDERGWGLAGDTFHVMEGLRDLGVDVWFNLGDRDLAIGIERARRLAEEARLTETIIELTAALGIKARVLPMCDEPVRTYVQTNGRMRPFQRFMIVERGAGPVDTIDITGLGAASPTPEVLDAISRARAIVIGPSNPMVSIGPILAVPGMREALRSAAAPVVAVSPVVAGQVLKGPTAAFLEWAGLPLSAAGVAGWYGDAIDGMVADEAIGSIPVPREDPDRLLWELGGPERQRDPSQPLPVLQTDLLMADAAGRSRLAREALAFAETLRGA